MELHWVAREAACQRVSETLAGLSGRERGFFRMSRLVSLARVLACAALVLSGTHNATGQTGQTGVSAAPQSTWTTLGTSAGPIPNPKRSQPANLLTYGTEQILVDTGDGACEQLGKAGVALGKIQTVFLSHLHFDHTGGLYAFLGLRFQFATPEVVTVYGPPGTKQIVDGLVAAMQPFAEVGAGLPGVQHPSPEKFVRVIEVTDGQKLTVGHAKVTVVKNTHYSYPEGSADAQKFQSLSFRFDMPDRSIVYTGDTGPSAKVEELAKGADLLVSEVLDPDVAMNNLRRVNPEMTAAKAAEYRAHFTEQHLSPVEVGKLAAKAGVKEVVLTHNGLGTAVGGATALVGTRYAGSTVMANDLDKF